MLKREDRERKRAEWLEHLQSWKKSGVSLSAYARQQGLALWAVYQWRAQLMREGLWQEESRTHRRGDVSLRVPLRFARVQIAPEASPMIVRVKLSNGRCAEIEIGAIEQLGEVLGVLERVP